MALREQLASAYSGKRVLITGHTGFKGSWLVALLHSLGAELKGYALAADADSLYRAIGADAWIDSITADLREEESLRSELNQFQPHYVFHLAAQSLVIEGYRSPAETYAVNVQGTVNLLEAIRELPAPCQTIVVTSDKVYLNREWVHPYDESAELGGYDPYSASKACVELVANAYRSSFFPIADYGVHGKGLATARAGNIIGGGDWSSNRIIPDAIRALAKGQSIPVRNPRAVRPWQHVLDPLCGYLQLAARLASGKDMAQWSGAWNFGPQESHGMCVAELVERVIQAWGQGDYVHVESHGPHEAGLLRLDCSKAQRLLNWQPEMNQSAAINYTVQWYRSMAQGDETAEACTQRQIDEYLSGRTGGG